MNAQGYITLVDASEPSTNISSRKIIRSLVFVFFILILYTYVSSILTYNTSATFQTQVSEYIPPSEEFQLSELIVEPLEVEQNEVVSVFVTVKNMGNSSGPHTVELELNYEIIDNETVTLGPQESTTVGFTLSTDEIGNHIIETGSLYKTFRVVEQKSGSFNIPFLVIDFVLISIILAVVYYLRKAEII